MQSDEANVNCAWLGARVEEYVDDDGGLTAAERGAIERHAATCADCRAAIAEAEAIVRALRAFPEVPVPASVIDAAERAIAGRERVVRLRPTRPNPIRWVPSLVAAAALVAAIVTAEWTPRQAPLPVAAGDAEVEEAARETMLALSYVSTYARRTGDILTHEVGRRLVAPVERAMEKSGIVETKPSHERS